MALYQFILTPLDKFYFGKERHPIRPSYYMESNPFPQQTGILGLVRHFLLLSTGKIDKKSEWDDLIGDKYFNGSIGQKYGKINKVYPTFIYSDDKQILLPVKELDNLFFIIHNGIKVNFDNKKESELHRLTTTDNSIKLKEQLNVKESYFNDAFVDDDYSALIPIFCKTVKDFSPPVFYGIRTNQLHKEKGVFIKHEQPGILKSYKALIKENEKKEEKGYFKTQYFKLNKGFHFSFLADINENMKTDNPIFMSFGGENSSFKVTIKDKDIPKISSFDNSNANGNIFHFISDTIIEKSAFDHVLQFIGETQFFRSMKTDAKNNLIGIYNLNRDLSNFKNIFNSSKLLIKKGSIAFINANEIQTFIDAIGDAQFTPYNKIGYNYYKQINKF